MSTMIKTPKTLVDASVKILTDRLGDEYTAHYFYRNATNWCAGIGYLKAAAFFAQEACQDLPEISFAYTTLLDITGNLFIIN